MSTPPNGQPQPEKKIEPLVSGLILQSMSVEQFERQVEGFKLLVLRCAAARKLDLKVVTTALADAIGALSASRDHRRLLTTDTNHHEERLQIICERSRLSYERMRQYLAANVK